MLDEKTARKIIKDNLPDGVIQYVVPYRELFVFQVFDTDELEGTFDPFFSVNKTTGEFRDFSVLTDGGPDLFPLLEAAHKEAQK